MQAKKNFSVFKKLNWKSPDIDWRKARYITVGIDAGFASCQAVIAADGKIFAYGNMRTGYDIENSAINAFQFALDAAGCITKSRINYCISTGYGMAIVPFADRSISEIACHARGANFIFGDKVRTVIDIGGQNIKAMRCDEKGKVINFLINDRCASGAGKGIEIFSDLLEIPISEIGKKSFEFKGRSPKTLLNLCVVYAKSEAVTLLKSGCKKEEVIASFFNSIAKSICSIIEKLGGAPEFAFTGGVAKNRGIIDRVVQMMGVKRMQTEVDTQIAGAAGAALFAHTLCLRGEGKKVK